MIYSVAPFLIVSVLFYYTAVVQTDVNQLQRRTRTSSVDVEAFQWNWKFSYPDTDGPGRPAGVHGRHQRLHPGAGACRRTSGSAFVEHSPDVIHSFWVPEMLFKRDVFPGNVVNQFETTILDDGRLRRPLRRAVRHVPLDDELRAARGDAGEVRPVPRGQAGRARRRPRR